MLNYSFVLSLCSLFLFAFPIHAEETFDPDLESAFLHSIEQITFPEMGFTDAGEGYFSPDAQTILFQAYPNGSSQYQIYSMRLDERIPRMVSTGKGSCTCAYFRPDGKKILFASSHADPFLDERKAKEKIKGKYEWEFTPYMNIYEASPDGSDLVPLTSGPAYHAECSYSSDGAHIVYASNEDGSMNLYVMKSDGTDVVQVTHTTGCYNGGPFFSPDNSKIIFRADRQKPHYHQIYVIDVDGQNERQITFFESAVNWAPYWHPNGEIAAFTTSLHGHMHYEIYLVNVLTGKTSRLTHNAAFDGLPVFDASGLKMMWTSKRSANCSCQLFIADCTIPNL